LILPNQRRVDCDNQPCHHGLDYQLDDPPFDLEPAKDNKIFAQEHRHPNFICGPEYPHLFNYQIKKDYRLTSYLNQCPVSPCPGRTNAGTLTRAPADRYRLPNDQDYQEPEKPENPIPPQQEQPPSSPASSDSSDSSMSSDSVTNKATTTNGRSSE
jgi:hypothetical protein